MTADTSTSPRGESEAHQPTVSPGSTPADVVATSSVEVQPAPKAAAAELSNVPTSASQATTAKANVSELPLAKSVVQLPGDTEAFGPSKYYCDLRRLPIEVEAGFESSLEEILKRSESLRYSIYGFPHPHDLESYGTTEELFTRVKTAIAEQASLSEESSAMLTYWVFSTWLADALPFAPCMVISGSAHEGDLVLDTLKHFCRNASLMSGVNTARLDRISTHILPTLLIYDPELTKQMASLLGSSTKRGVLDGRSTKSKDFFCPKAIYLGEDLPANRTPRNSVHVDATAGFAVQKVKPLAESSTTTLLNQLLSYRSKNLVKAYKSDFDASELPAESRSIANALAAGVVDSPKLQSELVSLLAPQAEQRLAERSSSPEGVTIEALLALCHQGKTQLFAGEIAVEVNRISKARGERLKFSPEKVGHALKKVGLFTRRLGQAGKGLVVDPATAARVHQLSAVYGCVGLGEEDENLHCPLCAENTWVM